MDNKTEFLWATPDPRLVIALACRRCTSPASLFEIKEEIESKGKSYIDRLLHRVRKENALDVFEHVHVYFLVRIESAYIPGMLESHLLVSPPPYFLQGSTLGFLVSGNLRAYWNYINLDSTWLKSFTLQSDFSNFLMKISPELFQGHDVSAGEGWHFGSLNVDRREWEKPVHKVWSTDLVALEKSLDSFGFVLSEKMKRIHGTTMISISHVSRVLTHQLLRHRRFSFDQLCYSSDTEVLTESGWKHFDEVDWRDRIATLNADTEHLEYQLPVEIFKSYYSGPMYHIKTGQVDCLITPNHNVFYKLRRSTVWDLKPICELDKYLSFEFKKDAIWNKSYDPIISVPGHTKIDFYKGKAFPYQVEDIAFDSKSFMSFLGYYISEGYAGEYLGSNGYLRDRIGICQKKKSIIPNIEKCLSNLPIHASKQISKEGLVRWTIQNRSLFEYLKPLGKSHERFIPKSILSRSKEELLCLFNALLDGDGSRSKNNWRYYTSSIRLANDVQELALKCGYSANIVITARTGTRRIFNYPMHTVHIIKDRNTPMLNFGSSYNFRTIEEYNGMVYCVSVPNKVIYVRRNGRSVWCGNSQRFSSADNEEMRVPRTIALNTEALDVYLDEFSRTFKTFVTLRDDYKIPKEDARFIIPSGIGTKLVMTGSLCDFDHVIQMRDVPQAQWEIRETINEIKAILKHIDEEKQIIENDQISLHNAT